MSPTEGVFRGIFRKLISNLTTKVVQIGAVPKLLRTCTQYLFAIPSLQHSRTLDDSHLFLESIELCNLRIELNFAYLVPYIVFLPVKDQSCCGYVLLYT